MPVKSHPRDDHHAAARKVCQGQVLGRLQDAIGAAGQGLVLRQHVEMHGLGAGQAAGRAHGQAHLAGQAAHHAGVHLGVVADVEQGLVGLLELRHFCQALPNGVRFARTLLLRDHGPALEH